jgi:uncharacterized protein (TIGR02421 family)
MPVPLASAAVEADATLAEVAASFDYLLYVSPRNSHDAWRRFSAASTRQPPRFTYRDVDVDVVGLRRRLEAVPIDAVEDPAIARLLAGKRDELLHYLGLLDERGTAAFLRRSIALSGGVDDDLLTVAEELLEATADDPEDPESTVTAVDFAARAEAELRAYRAQDATLRAGVQVRDDVGSLMVTGNQLLVPADRRLSPGRVEALIHHEVGVHILTWWNGDAQPLRMLADGLGGYLEAQEALGVLAELLSDGLSVARLRVLAARVVAARSVIDGATFLETYADLHDGRGLPAEGAFDLAERVHRGGGLVKDAVYLRGLVRLIDLLQEGLDLDLLLVGKPSLDDLGDIAALLARGVLHPPRVRPRWLDGAGRRRLAAVRAAPDVTSALLGWAGGDRRVG